MPPMRGGNGNPRHSGAVLKMRIWDRHRPAGGRAAASATGAEGTSSISFAVPERGSDDDIRSMSGPLLSHAEILLLLDQCIVKVRACTERIMQAEQQGRHSKVAYLRNLRAHYVSKQESLEWHILQAGVTPSELAEKLAHLDRRSTLRDPSNAGPSQGPLPGDGS